MVKRLSAAAASKSLGACGATFTSNVPAACMGMTCSLGFELADGVCVRARETRNSDIVRAASRDARFRITMKAPLVVARLRAREIVAKKVGSLTQPPGPTVLKRELTLNWRR